MTFLDALMTIKADETLGMRLPFWSPGLTVCYNAKHNALCWSHSGRVSFDSLSVNGVAILSNDWELVIR